MVVVYKWLFTFVRKKHDHFQGKSLICHLVLEGRVWLYIYINYIYIYIYYMYGLIKH